jgi:NhaA family Na+:H+ antiporter
VHEAGLHTTLAGVVLAFFIPTRPPPNLRALMAQADAVVQASAPREGEVLRHRLSAAALRALDAIHDRLESPADRFLRHIEPWSTYLVLPIFALANAGVALGATSWNAHAQLTAAIMTGLVIGKPLGLFAACVLAVRLGAAEKPEEYSWMQILGAGTLAGIGFTMSLFIAGQAFPRAEDFAAAKIAVFAASAISGLIGLAILWRGAGNRR